VPADEDGLARLVLALGTEVSACVEMMSGALWVRDQLSAAGWDVQVAHARKVRDVAPLACKTDKVDARVLAELCRRDLVPSLWVPSLDERALRERLRRRMHLVRLRASAMNRVFGLLTQWGLRISLDRLRADDAMQLLADRGVEETWRRSIAEALAVIELFDERLAPLERELRQAAKADARVILLKTIPGVGDLLGLTLGSERRQPLLDAAQADRLRRPCSARQPVRRPVTHRSAVKSRISHPALGRDRSRTRLVAADRPVAPALQRARQARRQEPRQVVGCPEDPHGLLAHPQPPTTLQARPLAAERHRRLGKLQPLSGRLTAPHGIEKPRQLPRTICATSAEREMSNPLTSDGSTNDRAPPS
jgi:transposase